MIDRIKLEGGLGQWSLSAARQLQIQDPVLERELFAGIFGGFARLMKEESKEIQSIKLMLQEAQQVGQTLQQKLGQDRQQIQQMRNDQLQIQNELERLQRELNAIQQQLSVEPGTVASDIASASTKAAEKDKEQK